MTQLTWLTIKFKLYLTNMPSYEEDLPSQTEQTLITQLVEDDLPQRCRAVAQLKNLIIGSKRFKSTFYRVGTLEMLYALLNQFCTPSVSNNYNVDLLIQIIDCVSSFAKSNNKLIIERLTELGFIQQLLCLLNMHNDSLTLCESCLKCLKSFFISKNNNANYQLKTDYTNYYQQQSSFTLLCEQDSLKPPTTSPMQIFNSFTPSSASATTNSRSPIDILFDNPSSIDCLLKLLPMSKTIQLCVIEILTCACKNNELQLQLIQKDTIKTILHLLVQNYIPVSSTTQSTTNKLNQSKNNSVDNGHDTLTTTTKLFPLKPPVENNNNTTSSSSQQQQYYYQKNSLTNESIILVCLKFLSAVCYENPEVSSRLLCVVYSNNQQQQPTICDIVQKFLNNGKFKLFQIYYYAAKFFVNLCKTKALQPDHKYVSLGAMTTLIHLCTKYHLSCVYLYSECLDTLTYLLNGNPTLHHCATYTEQLLSKLFVYVVTPTKIIGDDIDTTHAAIVQIRASALTLLAVLSSHFEDIRKRISEQDNLISTVIECYRTSNIPLQLASLRLFHGLSRSVQQLRTTFNDNICDLLLDSIKSRDLAVVKVGSCVISNVVMEFSTCRMRLLNGGILETLLNLLDQTDRELSLNAMWAIRNMTYLASLKVKQDIINNLTGERIYSTLEQCSDKQFLICLLSLLRNLFLEKDVDILIHLFDPMKLLTILQAMLEKDYPEEIHEQIIYLLDNLASNEYMKTMMKESDQLFKKISSFKSNIASSLQIAATTCLSSLDESQVYDLHESCEDAESLQEKMNEHLTKLEKELEQMINMTWNLGVTVTDFQTQSQTRLYQLLESLINSLKEVDQMKIHFNDIHIPGQLLSYVDELKNPQLYTSDCLKHALERNEELKGKNDALEKFATMLSVELSTQFPNQMAQYRLWQKKTLKEGQTGIDSVP
ncbi:unnamed protein product [Didymodactylos carnosus]|uniref:Armadillo repeat-containing protein 8 n=1 Tax=Didymodactylos carnosus TaxID=1234261 RepID=A0A813SYS1_9BILA|nr:unnamed protein product [Didymodactylos carnosus]CAF0804599.1 unnamed protein product [Didymodactylos carnosus]CAF3559728.1 unnamed protein product [Didymodactylos carnosus]CAF3589921.1 unnamed protein product [Didymodactylos carnosus]